MPLPDERPRASVANLIGRFEQHNKRQSLSPAVPLRSSISAESSKEEPKEKREWPQNSPDPPKSVLVNDTLPANLPQQVVNLDELDVTPAAPRSPSPPSADKSSKPKPPASTSMRSAAKALPTSARSAPRPSDTPSATSIKPQHTGQSTTSNTSSTRKTAVSRTAPSTPSHPKTPRTSSSVTSPPRAKTPSRPKTPSATSRPKTPSSGLFAPTAASLARSRNAPLQSTPPTRKVGLSNAATDRLSKPTAASLSKARTPVVVSTRGSPVTRGTATGRGAKSKTVTTSPTGSNQSPAKPAVNSTTQPQIARDEVARITNGHHDLTNLTALQVEKEDNGQTANVHDEESTTLEHYSDADVPSSPISDSQSYTSSTHVEEENGNGETTPVVERFSDTSLTVVEDSNNDKADVQSHPPHTEVGNDIEDIVNLLETARARPISIISIPDEVNEIPDEE